MYFIAFNDLFSVNFQLHGKKSFSFFLSLSIYLFIYLSLSVSPFSIIKAQISIERMHRAGS